MSFPYAGCFEKVYDVDQVRQLINNFSSIEIRGSNSRGDILSRHWLFNTWMLASFTASTSWSTFCRFQKLTFARYRKLFINLISHTFMELFNLAAFCWKQPRSERNVINTNPDHVTRCCGNIGSEKKYHRGKPGWPGPYGMVWHGSWLSDATFLTCCRESAWCRPESHMSWPLRRSGYVT